MTEYICKKCGLRYAEKDAALHNAPNHEIRVSEDYIGDGEYKSVPAGSSNMRIVTDEEFMKGKNGK